MQILNSNESYRAMVEEIEDYAILLIDINGIVINWNKGAEKIKGYKAEEIIGKSFSLFYTANDRLTGLPEKLLNKASKNGKASDEGWRVRKDGTRFWGSILITAVHGENQEVIGFSKVTRDLTERRNAEETEKSLVETKEGLYIIFNASSSGMTLTDVDSRKLIEVNKSFLTTFGFSREEVIGSNSGELHIVSDKTRARLAENLSHQGYLKNEDIQCFTKDEKEINCILSADLFEMNGKKYFLSVFQDISTIKNMERRAKESEEKFQKAFQSNAAGIGITRLSDLTYLEVNDAFVKMTGYSREEIIGRNSDELALVVDLDYRDKIIKEVKNHDSVRHFELAIRNKSGEISQILSSVETIWLNDEKYAISTMYDITERKKTEVQIAHLAAIVEFSDDAIISKTIEGVIKSWNRGAEKMLGYTAEQAIGQNISLIIPREYIKEEKKILEKICNNEIVDHYETIRIKNGGEQLHASLTVSPLKNSSGEIIGVSKIIRDITERKKAEDSSRLKDAFLSLINHEIRTPLNAIMGFSDVLLNRNIGKTENQYLAIIKKAGEDLLTIISDTIDMSRIETDTMIFKQDKFSIIDVLETLNKKLTPAAEQKNLDLSFNCDKDIAQTLYGDEVRLEQIVSNLTNNAIKFSDRGEIIVKAVLLKKEDDNNIVEFTVSDTGKGISPSKQKTIFDRFRQLEPHDTREHGGLGLGLSITKKLVELQGGSLSVESEEGVGSLFTFSLAFKNIDDSAFEK